MKSNFNFYGAVGLKGYTVACSYNQFLKIKRFLGRKATCKGFSNPQDAISWAITKYNQLTCSNLARPDQLQNLGTVIFTDQLMAEKKVINLVEWM